MLRSHGVISYSRSHHALSPKYIPSGFREGICAAEDTGFLPRAPEGVASAVYQRQSAK